MKEYHGPETNPVYEDTTTMETFEDLEEDDTYEEPEHQSTTSHDGNEGNVAGEEEEEVKQEKLVKSTRAKKEADKKIKGQKGDDLDVLEDEEETEEEAPDAKKEGEEEEDEEDVAEVKKDEEAKPIPKGKASYITVGDETFALDSNSLVATTVDGKTEKVSLQELKNNYAGKVSYDKKFNEINVKEQGFKRQEAQFNEKVSKFTGLKSQIDAIIKNPESNPKDAYKIFLDSIGVDSYDLIERGFKADLTELANVLNMEPAERKAYFLEKKNSHLLEQGKKRDDALQESGRVNSYREKVNALRNSFGVSEAQYVDALEELKSYGTKDEDLSEKSIVEWAATKPHRATVKTLLEPYRDQLAGDAYGELTWDLANILLSGIETKEVIQKHLAEVYGVPTEVRQLSKKLNPLGRKPTTTIKQSPKNGSYESFDDINEE